MKRKNKWKKNKPNYIYLFSFSFFFSSHSAVKTIWSERFQLKLDWWLYCNMCEKKKREKKRNEIFIKFDVFFSYFFILFFLFILVIFIKTIWMEQFQLKLDWWLHWHICENKKRRKERYRNEIKFVFFVLKYSFFF